MVGVFDECCIVGVFNECCMPSVFDECWMVGVGDGGCLRCVIGHEKVDMFLGHSPPDTSTGHFFRMFTQDIPAVFPTDILSDISQKQTMQYIIRKEKKVIVLGLCT